QVPRRAVAQPQRAGHAGREEPADRAGPGNARGIERQPLARLGEHAGELVQADPGLDPHDQVTGGVPQASLVPPPRGTDVKPSDEAAASTAAASVTPAGRATNRGATPATASPGP